MAPGYEDRTEISVFIAAARQGASEDMATALCGGIGGLGTRIAGWWRRRAAAATLMRLDDRMLRDIGLTRHQVQAIASGVPIPAEADDRAPAVGRTETSVPDDMPAGSSNDNLGRRRAA